VTGSVPEASNAADMAHCSGRRAHPGVLFSAGDATISFLQDHKSLSAKMIKLDDWTDEVKCKFNCGFFSSFGLLAYHWYVTVNMN